MIKLAIKMKSSILNIMTQKERLLQNMGIREVREYFLEEVIFKPRPKGQIGVIHAKSVEWIFQAKASLWGKSMQLNKKMVTLKNLNLKSSMAEFDLRGWKWKQMSFKG